MNSLDEAEIRNAVLFNDGQRLADVVNRMVFTSFDEVRSAASAYGSQAGQGALKVGNTTIRNRFGRPVVER